MFSVERIKKLLSGVLVCPGQSERSPEQSLEVFRQLCTTSVAWVHGDEDAHSGVQGDLLPFELGDKSKGRKGYAAGQPARGKVAWGAVWLLVFMDKKQTSPSVSCPFLVINAESSCL